MKKTLLTIPSNWTFSSFRKPRERRTRQASWGNSPDVRAESVDLKRFPVLRAALATTLASAGRAIETALDRRQTKVMPTQDLTGITVSAVFELANLFVCMILPGGGSRLQTLRSLAAQLFNSTLRTFAY
jgi:hypothetical protein